MFAHRSQDFQLILIERCYELIHNVFIKHTSKNKSQEISMVQCIHKYITAAL